MKLWKRAVGVLKDKRSIYVAGVTRRTSYRNPHLEAIIIKATSHDDSFVDYKNFQRVYQWARTSPLYTKPLIWSLSNRMDKTRTWVVALKGLMLIHGVICCKIPALQRIGRLPFDLSSFTDGHTKPSKSWGFNAFVRAYFAYLDQRSFLVFSETNRANTTSSSKTISSLAEELRRLVTWQALMDLLLQVRPQAENMRRVGLVFEAMICVVTEVFEVHEKIRKSISQAVARAYDHSAPPPGTVEVGLARGILRKATVQGDELCLFFELCREMGVLNASFCPKVERIPAEEDFRELMRIVDGVCNTKEELSLDHRDHRDHDHDQSQDRGTIVIVDHRDQDERSSKTIITEKWEIFDEDHHHHHRPDYNHSKRSTVTDHYDSNRQLIVLSHPPPTLALPDLITF
ncbi:putative clathrin assembly protein At1g25240 [Humulus lupulus]|uniref:putative clathrin assembly protein At1g25240 n=1 Tax=Humulus lupulus TaxID=3486 RepID=UPI002B40A62D|nr:putative clathrin assembly protein At1g25240 [Humulus lupulus]